MCEYSFLGYCYILSLDPTNHTEHTHTHIYIYIYGSKRKLVFIGYGLHPYISCAYALSLHLSSGCHPVDYGRLYLVFVSGKVRPMLTPTHFLCLCISHLHLVFRLSICWSGNILHYVVRCFPLHWPRCILLYTNKNNNRSCNIGIKLKII